MNVFRRVAVILLLAMLGSVIALGSPAEASSFSPGQGSSNPQVFIDAYNRIGGSSRIGQPFNAVHSWNAGCVQDFNGGWSGKAAIMQPGCSGPAYYVVYRQWTYIESRWGGNATAVIGYPTGDDFRWGAGWAQHFAGGSQNATTLARSDHDGVVRQVWGGIRHYWVNFLGGAGGSLGYPTSEEYGWNGVRRQDFRGGSILWDPVNKARLYQPPPPPPSVSSREQRAVSWVIAEKNSPNPAWSDEFNRPWSGYCEGFVEVAFGTRGQFASANAHYQWQRSRGLIRTDTNPPPGAVVFYGGASGYGHAGISLGGGQVISTQGFNDQRLPVWQHGVTGLSNPYLGWAYAPNHWTGR